jgi:hypothetical protein
MNGATNPWSAQESCLQFVAVPLTRSVSQRLLVTSVTINKASIMSTQLALNPTQFIYGELVFYAGA